MYIESGNVYNDCSDNDEPISKDNPEIVVHCSPVRASTVFFFHLSKGKRAGTNSDISNEGSDESGILHIHCSENDEPNSKDKPEIALHCSPLRA